MASNKLDPKHESQKIVMRTVDSVFYRSIGEREKLIGEDAKLHKEKIMTLD